MNFVIAFMGEARPIIDYYGLQKVSHRSHQLFQNNRHSLILSGPGKDRASLATEVLAKLTDIPNQAWINLRIAGPGTFAKGDLFIAAKIEDDQTEKSFFPPQIYGSSLKVGTVITCTKPSHQYKHGQGYDMESHAFYQAAIGYSIRELVQVIKIVSDNPTQPVDKFSPKEAPNLIIQHLPAIDALVMQMDQACESLQTDQALEESFIAINKTHSFSFTRSHQLYNLVKHAKLLDLDMNIVQELARSSANASDAIQKISDFIKPHRILG